MNATSTDTRTLRDYSGNALDAIELTGEPNFPVRAEIGDEDSAPMVVVWDENLDWHRERFADSDDAAAMFTEDGALTPKAAAAAMQVIADALPANAGWQVVDGFSDSTEPTLSVEIVVPGVTLDTTVEEAVNTAYTAVATLINITDPGTFGSTYLFADVAEKVAADE